MRMRIYRKNSGFGLTIALLTALTVMLVGAGTLWSVRSIYTTIEQEDALWEDLQQVGAAVRVFAAEQNRPPLNLQELRDMGYISPRTGEVFINREYEWKLEYGKVRIFLGKTDEETGAESYVHDSKGVPYLVVAEYRSPEPVVYVRHAQVVDGEGTISHYNEIHAHDTFGRFLFTFKTPDTTNNYGSNMFPISWSPASDRIIIATRHDNKIHEYTFKGEKVREFVLDTSLGEGFAGIYLAIGNDGRIFVSKDTTTAGEDGLICYSKDGIRLWTKKIGTDFKTNPDTVMRPLLTASCITPDGNLLVYNNGKLTNKMYSPSGTHLKTETASYVIQSMPDKTYISYAHADKKGYRTNSSWAAMSGAENTLDLLPDYGVGRSAFAYGRHFVLSSGDKYLLSFDWNPDLGTAKTNFHATELNGVVTTFTVRKGTDVWVTSSLTTYADSFVSKIGVDFGVEKSFNTNAMASFASRAVGVAPDETGNVYITSTTVNGIFKINSSGTVSQIIPSSYSYTGLEFDENGYLWAGRCFPQQAIDVFDVAKATPELVFTVETSGFIVSGIKKDPWGRMWAITSSGASTPDMLPRVYDKNGNFLFEFDGGGTLPSQNVAGIAFTPDGRIFAGVMGSGDNTVFVYNSVGELEYRMPLESGAHGYGMDIDITGRLWVAEGESSVVSIYDTISFKKLAEMPLTGLGNVMHLKARSVVRPKPEVFVTQSNITKIKALDSSLALSSEFGEYGTDLAWRMRVPLGVASVGDLLFTADRDNRKVHVSTPTGLYLRDFGSGVLKSPRDIEVDEVTGRAFVLDKRADGTMDIEVFDAEGRHVPDALPWKNYREKNPDTTKYTFSNNVQGMGYYGSYGRKSRLVVADTGNDRVVIYDGLGYFITEIRGLLRPIDAAVNPDTLEVLVLEESSSSVKVYSIVGQTAALVRTIGSPGTADGKFDRPKKIAVMGGSLYIADYNRIQRMNASTGAFVGSYRLGTGDAHVGGLAVKKTPKAYLYAADAARKRVIAYDAWGNFTGEFLVKKESGETPLGEAVAPKAVAVDQEGNVFVADALNFVRKYKPDGTFMTKFGGTGTTNGKLSGVYDMHIHDQSLYVTERGNNRVQKFDTSGNFQLIMATNGEAPGYISNPGGIAADPQDGKVWVMDTGNHRMLLFDSTGTFAKVAGIQGSGVPSFDEETGTPLGEVELSSPLSAAVVGFDMLVLDDGNGRMQRTDTDGAFKAVDIDNLPTGILSMKAGADGRVFAPWNTDGIVAVFRAGSTDILRIGEAGSGRGQLDDPVSVAVAPVYREYVPGVVYIADSDMKIRAYDDEMNFLFSFGGRSYGVGEITYPYDIIRNPSSGNIHVLNTLQPARLYTFSPSGTLLNTTYPMTGTNALVYKGGNVYAGYGMGYSPSPPSERTQPVYRLDGLGNLAQTLTYSSSGLFTDSEGKVWTHNTYDYGVEDIAFLKWTNNVSPVNVFFGGNFTHHQPFQNNLVPASGYGGGNPSSRYNFMVVDRNRIYIQSYSNIGAFNTSGSLIRNFGSLRSGRIKAEDNRVFITSLSLPVLYIADRDLNQLLSFDFSKLPIVLSSVAYGHRYGFWVDSSNRAYISNFTTKKAYSFTSGAVVPLAEYGYYNVSSMNFSNITSMSADTNALYVLDNGNRNIKKFDLLGNIQWQRGDTRSETQWVDGNARQKIDIDASYVYIPSFADFSIRILNKATGSETSKKTFAAYNYQNGFAAIGGGKLRGSLSYVINTENDGLYYKLSVSDTGFTKGPANPSATGYFAALPGTNYVWRSNLIHRVKNRFLLSSNNGYIWVFDFNDNFLGRKSGIPGDYSKEIRYFPSTDEIWILNYLNAEDNNRIYVYDYNHFMSSSAPSVKRIIELGYNAVSFTTVVPPLP